MKLPPLRLQHGLLFALLALLFFGWGAWLMRPPAAVEPLPELAVWQAQLFPALANEQLALAELSGQTDGELWLQSQAAGPRLLYRGPLAGAEGGWTLMAELHLSGAERESLVAAAGFQPGNREQPLSRQLLEPLARLPVLELELTPITPVSAARLAATLGQPRLRLQIEGGEAWVYPALGLTARMQGDTLLSLRALPKRAMQH
ncbi:MAG: hypothetical protein Q8R10_11785 [Pseudomonas sp.]|uniref:hypothetical protein n=1 Tax=Pseudomonas sp. TaxID=306 RepID=UPI00273668CE|nr:hypothetical protein [Pseudomonas sp.]MDP3847089.1 hypothetical protein [Pseudomonas sp.]